jgi:hypothetical protein
MAITNSQQARQMYKEGSKEPVMQGGGPNYLGKQKEVTTPIKWKSSPEHPDTELAYITEPEKQVLIALNMHGGLEDGKPNKGPNGIMSLQGDLGGYDASPGGPNDGGSKGDRNKTRASDIMTGRVSTKSSTGITEGYKGPSPTGRNKAGDFFGQPSFLDKAKSIYSKLPTPLNIIRNIATKFGPLNNLDFYNEKVVPAGKTNLSYDDYMSARMAGTIDAYGNPIDQDNDNGNNNVLTAAQLLAQQQAAANAAAASNVPTTTQQPGIAYRFMADGGIANTEVARQNYFVGGIIKKATKAVKKIGSKVNRARKKVLKNPYVQTAIALYAPYAIGSTGFMAGASPFMRQAAISGLTQGGLQLASGQGLDAKGILRSAALSGALATMNPAQGAQPMTGADKAAMVDYSDMSKFNDLGLGGSGGAANIKGGIPSTNIFDEVALTPRVGANITAPSGDVFAQGDLSALEKIDPKVIDTLSKTNPEELSKFAEFAKKIDGSKIGGALLGDGKGGISAIKAIGLASALPLLGVGAPPEDDEGEPYRGEGIDIEAIRANPYNYMAPRFMAEGGSAEPVAKKVMPLLDMGGQEMDLRAEGGFVPIGRMEKADDVPARLSKNEFVFTAEAVRNAGDGDIDKGAEVMYNMMKNLESGGDVSEESQGLDGAKQMFQTSQRLGEVI